MKIVKIKYLMPNEPVNEVWFKGKEIEIDIVDNFTNFYVVNGDKKSLKSFRKDVLVSYKLDIIENEDSNLHTV